VEGLLGERLEEGVRLQDRDQKLPRRVLVVRPDELYAGGC
jgi:hypothetical protein